MASFALPGAQGDTTSPALGTSFAVPGASGDAGNIGGAVALSVWISLMASATSAFAITPSDSADLPGITTGGLIVGVAGTVTATLASGATVQFTLAAGYYPIACKRIWSTGTAATNLTGLLGGA